MTTCGAIIISLGVGVRMLIFSILLILYLIGAVCFFIYITQHYESKALGFYISISLLWWMWIIMASYLYFNRENSGEE